MKEIDAAIEAALSDDQRIYHTHNEYRAPTDQSVKLLREMESAARAEVTKAVALPSNDLTGVIHTMYDPLTGNTKVAVLFELNRKKHRVDITLNEFADRESSAKVEKMIDSVSTYLAGTILQQVITPQLAKELRL